MNTVRTDSLCMRLVAYELISVARVVGARVVVAFGAVVAFRAEFLL